MTEASKKKIAGILERHGVVVGYLFGSAASGKMGPHSDVDVAVFFDEKKIPREKQFDEKLAISSEIAKACGVKDADVINLNQQTNPVLRYDAVILGEAIFASDPSIKAALARSALREYEDTQHLRETSYRIMREQAKSGQFGRAPATLKKHVPA